jgi:hypothetical protein
LGTAAHRAIVHARSLLPVTSVSVGASGTNGERVLPVVAERAVAAGREMQFWCAAAASGEEEEQADEESGEGRGGEEEGMTELHGERLRRISVRRKRL